MNKINFGAQKETMKLKHKSSHHLDDFATEKHIMYDLSPMI